jgi:hypothetical protein
MWQKTGSSGGKDYIKRLFERIFTVDCLVYDELRLCPFTPFLVAMLGVIGVGVFTGQLHALLFPVMGASLWVMLYTVFR